MSMFHITADRLTTPDFHGASLWSHIEAFARAAGRSLSEWRYRIRQRNELMTLGELELRDILLNKSYVTVEASKWFWQA